MSVVSARGELFGIIILTMQETILTKQTLEELYEKVIVPQFAIEDDLAGIVWRGHSTIGPDADAHHFFIGKKEYALVFEDYPGLGVVGIHDEVAAPWQQVMCVGLTGHEDEAEELWFGPKELPAKYVHNVTGYFTLVRIV